MMNGMPGESLPADGQETVLRWVHRQKRTLDKLYEEYRADILSVREKEAARYAAITEELIREYDAKV
jgi:mRNA deadenylase 3'-5' endonuclease subunit Ccr4